jgi:hypothetical protein
VVEPKVRALAGGLREATETDTRTLRDKGAVGREMVIRHFGWDAIGREFLAIYRNLVDAEPESREPSGEHHQVAAAGEALTWRDHTGP